MSIAVLLVDDQPLVRTGLRVILESEPDIHVVAELGDGEAAVQWVAAHQVDVVLMDIRMPVLDGIEATRRACAARPSTRVLILTTFDLDEYVYGALRAGASGFIVKDTPRGEIVQAVRTIAAGNGLLSPTITRRLIREFARQDPSAPQESGRLATLTQREMIVLDLLARGLTNAEIGAQLFIAEGTVKAHVSNVLGKLGLRDRVQAVIFAYEAGLLRPGSGRDVVNDRE